MEVEYAGGRDPVSGILAGVTGFVDGGGAGQRERRVTVSALAKPAFGTTVGSVVADVYNQRF